MSSYNKMNGTYTSESHDLLTSLLRQKWDFKDLVMTDWYGGHDAVDQLKTSNDLLMPGVFAQTQAILGSLKSGGLTPAQARRERDARAGAAQVAYIQKGRLQQPAGPESRRRRGPPGRRRKHGAAAQRSWGPAPSRRPQGGPLFGNASCNLIAGGTGSGNVNRAYTISLAQGLSSAGYTVNTPLSQAYAQHLRADEAKLLENRGLLDPAPVIPEMTADAGALQQAVQVAAVAVLTLGRSAGEGNDRKETDDFTLTATERVLLKKIATAFHAHNKKVIVVINTGGVVEVANWRDQADAILLAWQPVQVGGNALADVLGGKTNPSGKLATTFPVAYKDMPYGADYPGKLLPGGTFTGGNTLMGKPSGNTYAGGIYAGYRYYSTFKVKPACEFGYGLSYATFAYGKLNLSTPTLAGKITASIQVTNSGKVAGKEVA